MFALGWFLDRRSRLDLHTLVKLNIQLFVPAFMFVHVVKADIASGLAARVVGFTVCIIACMFVISAIVGRLAGYDRPQVRSLQLAAMFYNSADSVSSGFRRRRSR